MNGDTTEQWTPEQIKEKDKQDLAKQVDEQIYGLELTRFKKNLLLPIGTFIGLLLLFWVIGNSAEGIIIGLEITIISITTVGTGALALGILISIRIINKQIDNAFDAHIAILRKKLNSE